MKSFAEHAPELLKSLSRKASVAFAEGDLSREDFDKVCDGIKNITEVVSAKPTSESN